MPNNVVKTKEQELIWEKAEKAAEKQGRKDNYAYIMQIYKNMGGIKKEASVNPLAKKIADKLINIATFKNLMKATDEKRMFDSQSASALRHWGFDETADVAELGRTRRALDDLIERKTKELDGLNRYKGNHKSLDAKLKKLFNNVEDRPDEVLKTVKSSNEKIRNVQQILDELNKAKDEATKRFDMHRYELNRRRNNAIGGVAALYGTPIAGGIYAAKKIKSDKNKET